MHRPLIKVSGITHLHDARYCAAVGVDILEFRMEKGDPLRVAPETIREISGWLSGPELMGEFGSAPADEILATAQQAGFTRISLPAGYADLSGITLPLVIRYPDRQSWKAGMAHNKNAWAECGFALTTEDLLSLDAGDRARTIATLEDGGLLSEWSVRQCLPGILQPGAFIRTPDGQLDYGACDAFLEQVQHLIPA